MDGKDRFITIRPVMNEKRLGLRHVLMILVLSGPQVLQAEKLQSGEYTISQSWKQERSFERLYVVSVPEGRKGKRPVVVFLHGGGGTRGAHSRGSCGVTGQWQSTTS